MSYKPLEFWTENGKSNIEYNTDKHKIQEQKLLEYLKTLEFKFKSVLEVGCGYGRITDLIINNFNITEYVGIDISKEQIDKIKAKYPISVLASKFKFFNLDITEYTPLIDEVDLVIAVDTLMHIKPNDIHDVIESMIYLSNKHVINMDYYIDEQEILAPHNFKHEYKDHYMRLGYSINTVIVKEIDQCIFHVVIK